MKHKLKTGGIFALALFLVYLYGCQNEELEIEQPISTKGIPFKVEVPQVESYFVAESSKGKVIDKLFKALGYTTRTGGNVTESYATEIGTILTDEILAVQDVFGTKYTFKLDHPEKDFYTFFNLVMVDKVDKTIVQLIKYKMAPEFAALYRSGQKQLDSFHGTTTSYVLSNPCLCEFPTDGVELDVIPGDYTETPGGGTVSNDSGFGSNPGGSSGGGSGHILEDGEHCGVVVFSVPGYMTTETGTHLKNFVFTLNTCTGEFDWSTASNRKINKDLNQTETYNENGCCSFGAIGIMDDTDGKKYLKKLLTTTGFLNKIASLQGYASNTQNNSEHGFSIAYSQPNLLTGTVFSGGFDYIRVLKGLNIVGFAHCHTLNGYPMFTVSDLINLNVIKNASTLNQSPELFTFILVTEDNVFAYQIKNVDQYNAFCDLMNSDLINKHNELVNLYTNSANTDVSSTRYINNLNSFLTKYNSGISFFKLNFDQTDWISLN